jgi:hypothetical protein
MATEFYITKYALTEGIKTITGVAESPDFLNGKEWVKEPQHWVHHYIGRNAFRTETEAKADANKRRNKKIASLKKQIGKLEAMEF